MPKEYILTVLPFNKKIPVLKGETLLSALRKYNLSPDAPCGGNGSCGKCRVIVDGIPGLACQVQVHRNITVQLLSSDSTSEILLAGQKVSIISDTEKEGYSVAVDIGTTTIAGYLLDTHGNEIAAAGIPNPQASYGADVISRIQQALRGEMESLTSCIRSGLSLMIQNLCQKADIEPDTIAIISVVGNPCMQQLFLGISPKNLASVPFLPVITESSIKTAGDFLPACTHALLLTVPDISGFVGGDTVSCILSTRMYSSDSITLMIDIGTNGEMVLGNSSRLIACSTAAGPALEGAKITFGMTAGNGAIDHVSIKDNKLSIHVIGGGTASGICGSGLIDAIACLLDLGILNKRGRLDNIEQENHERIVRLTESIYLTQNDIREVMLAKGAICAGIQLLVREFGITMDQIDSVLLAGAFGSFMNIQNACRIGLLPEELFKKTTPIGNAAGTGAKLIALSQTEFKKTDELVKKTEFLELANSPGFQREFAKQMYFRENKNGQMD